MDIHQIVAHVDHFYSQLEASAIQWDDPRPNMEEPPDEAYSRVSNPQRYQVVSARADAWCHVLVSAGLSQEDLVPIPNWASHIQTEAAVTLIPYAPGAAALTVVSGPVDPSGIVVIALGVGEPAERIEQIPDCGCDACDDGSADLLQAIDAAFMQVIAGDFVYARGKRWSLQAGKDTWQASSEGRGEQDWEKLIEQVRAGKSVGSRSILGKSWL